MKNEELKKASGYIKTHRFQKRWQKVVTGLAAVVVFFTTYALILPAITMEKEPFCQIPEHTHTEECYAPASSGGTLLCSAGSLSGHVHSLDCYNGEGETVCGYADFVLHSHNDSCYDEEGALRCSLPEISAHTHTAACYAGSAVHEHTEECYTSRQSELICPIPEGEGAHAHSEEDGCYDESGALICQTEESAGHQHTATCYHWEKVLSCSFPAQPEAAEPTCGQEERIAHTHTAACLDANGTLICGKTQLLEHSHSESCFAGEEPVLICTQEDHTHSLSCYSDPEADLETEEIWKQSLPKELSGNWAEDVLAVAKSQLGYTESSLNYIVELVDEEEEIKGYTRYGEWYGTPYGDWSATFVSFCLRYANVPNFPYHADCVNWVHALSEEYGLYEKAGEYAPKPGDIIFFDREQDGKSDHVGIVAELIPATEEEPGKLKTIEGNNGCVQYQIYAQDAPVILGYGRLPEKEPGFACGKVSHMHSTYCYGFEGSQLLCPFEEHRHTDECTSQPEEPDIEESITELHFSGEDYAVLVRYGAEAALPEGSVLQAEEVLEDSENYQAYLQQAAEAVNGLDPAIAEEVTFARFFDLRFVYEDQTVEPAGPVEVTLVYDTLPELGEGARTHAVHFAESGVELFDPAVQQVEDGVSFTHTQDSFSVVGSLVTLAEPRNPADIGPHTLPVDYYVCIDGEWVCVGSTKTGWYGDYNTGEWTNTNRDYITVQQAESILGEYGFHAADGNGLNKKVAYQQKSGNTAIFADVDTPTNFNETAIVPLSRNDKHPGYNLYYLPGNSDNISSVALDSLDKNANGFYTVKVYDRAGTLLKTHTVLTGGNFTYEPAESDVTDWLVVRGGSTEMVTGNSVTINNITTPVIISPTPEGEAGSHSVSFKVMVDGQWKTVGSLPYYYAEEDKAAITTGMAAQFFGPYGYTAGDSSVKLGYSYNDIYKIYYDQSTFCMDIQGGNIANNTKIQLYGENASDAQIFRIWAAENGYFFITPATNSGLFLNVTGGGSDNDKDISLYNVGFGDSSSQWKIQEERNNTVSFWSKNAPDSALIDLASGNQANGATIHIWNNGANRYWRLVQQYRISNKASVTSGKISTDLETNGDIVFYYLPAETQSTIQNVSESTIWDVNSLWSVSVRDDTHTVYTEGELSSMVQYVQNGGEATVTVKNGEGLIWSCVGKNGKTVDVTSTQASGYTTFVIKNITQPIEITSTKTNPSFTVQYYANIPRLAESGGNNTLPVIDTTAEKNDGKTTLPKNGANLQLRYIQLEATGSNTNQNRGNQTELYQVKTDTTLTRMYSEETYQYENSPGLQYFNKLKDNESFKLTGVGVLKEGKDPASTNDDDWDWYAVEDGNIDFTNVAAEANPSKILISDGAVLRLRFDTTTSPYYNGTTFYDYNISSGYNDGWRTGITGINSESNYSTSRNGERNWNSKADIFAFGNANCGTGMSGYYFDGGPLNKYNGNKNYLNTYKYIGVNDNNYGCTFGLASGLNQDGTIRYSDWLVVPKLFNDGDAYGKQTYAGSSLTFDRVGDTYTLSAATLNNGHTLGQLEYFFNPSPTNSTTYTHIFTNNFWPMDTASSPDKTDGLWGEYGNTGSFKGFYERGFDHNAGQWTGDDRWEDLDANFPQSDDGNAHNWFFGMNFAISFNLTADYVGPLEYTFFGDDDMWVFLDQTLICDIGGVHSSVGEYVNLRDYLPEGSSGQHTLSFFYTERGASGSTCWMQFTLPSVSSATTSRDTGSLQISKKLEGVDGESYSDKEYEFQVDLLTSENGSPLNQTFGYTLSDGSSYGTIQSGGTIKLKQNQTVTISGIPAGTFYRVTELTTQGYKTTVNGSEGYIASGTIETGSAKPAAFVNTPYHELPMTGGTGTTMYTMGGTLLFAGAALLPLYHNKKRGKEDFASS